MIKTPLLSCLLLSGVLCYSQESRKEQRIRERNERIEQQDHLEPEQGDLVDYKFSLDYHTQIRSILLDSLGDKPIIRMIVLPSFSPEYVISLEKVENKYIVTRVTLDSSVWYSKDYSRIKRRFATKTISSELSDSLSALYLLALSKTRYPDRPLIFTDGISYHFAAKAHFGIHTATKHSPIKGTRIAQLVQLTEKLMDAFIEKDLMCEIELLKARF